jgi:citrate lyase subunit beta/citryl-CoA lyase
MQKKPSTEVGAPMRSILFVPANRPDRIDKAVQTAADLVMVDLEDTIPLSQKADAREAVRAKVMAHAARRLFVRINGLGTGLCRKDIDAVAVAELQGIMLPKVETPDHLREIHLRLLAAEKMLAKAPGSIALLVLIESVLGVHNVFNILAQKLAPARHMIAAFGAADFGLDLGIDITLEGTELIVPRCQIAWASRIAELEPPIDTPFMIDLKDIAALKSDAARAKQLGYQGKLCIHPAQIGPCNEIFSPSAQEINFARQVQKAFDESTQKGVAVLQVNGKFIDKPIVERCRRLLQLAARMGQE